VSIPYFAEVSIIDDMVHRHWQDLPVPRVLPRSCGCTRQAL